VIVFFGKAAQIVRDELRGFSLRRTILGALERLIPVGQGGRVRAHLYRCMGCSIGPGTIFQGSLLLGTGSRLENLKCGARCFINSLVFVDAAGLVTLGDGVSVGHHVVIITTDHGFGPPEFRAGNILLKPVVIESGAWVAAGVTLLPGVTIGSGAVVAAGAVVTSDVPANSLFGGVPAKLIRYLPPKE
jgi:maltose O-acetyltransferase